MDLAVFIPIVAIIASTAIILTWMSQRHDRQVRSGSGDQGNLVEENARLRATVARLEERMAVLEEIATDPAQRTARQIEELRG